MKYKYFLVFIAFLLGFTQIRCGSKKVAEVKLEPEVPLQYEVRFPQDMDEEGTPSIVVALHGHNRDEKEATQLWDEGFFYEPDFILLSVRGPFKGTEGYEWFSQVDSLASDPIKRRRASAPTSEDRILDAINEFATKQNIEPGLIYLLGFSQGATMALDIGLRNPEIFDGIAAIAGNIDTFLLSEAKIKDIEDMDIFLAIGRGEGPRAVEAMEGTKDLLAGAGARVRLYLHDEGHTINARSCRAMQNFLELTYTEAPEDDNIYRPGSEDSEPDEEETPEYQDQGEDESDYQEE